MPSVNHRVIVEESNKMDKQLSVSIQIESFLENVSADELLVKIYLRPVHPADLASLSLSYPGFQPLTYPAVPGLEGVGRILAAGKDAATAFSVGDRIIGAPWKTKIGQGSWQQYATIKAADAMKVPDDIADETAAQLWVNPVTVFAFFDLLDIPQDEFLLQTAASSTLGKQIIMFARHKGIRTINVVRRASAKKELLALGGDVVVDMTTEVLVEIVDEVTGGRGAYAALDAVGGPSTGLMASCTRSGGEVIAYGTLAANHCTASLDDVMFRDVKLRGFWLHFWLLDNKHRKFEVFEELIRLFRDGILRFETGGP
eukprot:jgi/Botrbrau1/14256/Bobra.113_2s0004.2